MSKPVEDHSLLADRLKALRDLSDLSEQWPELRADVAARAAAEKDPGTRLILHWLFEFTDKFFDQPEELDGTFESRIGSSSDQSKS